MQSQLEKLLYSELGSLLQDKEGGIDLFEIMKRKESVIFSFNSGSYSEFIKRLGRFVIADIENNVTRMYEIDDNCYVTGIFDEFGAYGNANIVGIVARARSANFNSVMGIQSFGDLIIGGQNIAQQVIDNNNTFIFGRSNDNDSADKVANVIGTYRDEEVTHQTENLGPSRFHRVDMRSDKGTTRSVDSYHVHPNRIKGFDTGEFAVLRKSAMNLPIEERIKIVYFRNPLEGT
ncbi:TraM recognition domain-containing protein [Shouchella miscanthi]|uniref:TraM recognition domain-containing protein n=1 Tax=Shouchella miscanthi TaxID=2598861 RepID=A0ABU6NN67_9BACI|nr:TraM recognition domain-containing protein [Shouchella miscanthi]